MVEEEKENKKKLSKGKKIALYFIGVILLIGIAVTSFGYWYVNNMLNNVGKLDIINANSEAIGINPELYGSFGKVRNIALLGINSREGDVGRSDSIMILTLDGIHKKFKLTSIMRDSYVDIEGYGLDKVNHAYAFGGAEPSIKTINENFNLNIKEVMTVNFDSLINIIDKIGGVNINITEEEISHIPGVTSTRD